MLIHVFVYGTSLIFALCIKGGRTEREISVEFKLVLHFKCHSQKTMQYFRDGKFPNTIFAIIMT